MRNLLEAWGIPEGMEALIDGGLPGYDEDNAAHCPGEHSSPLQPPLQLHLHYEGSEHDFAGADPDTLAEIKAFMRPLPGSLLRPTVFGMTARCGDAATLQRLRAMNERVELKYSKAVMEIRGENP